MHLSMYILFSLLILNQIPGHTAGHLVNLKKIQMYLNLFCKDLYYMLYINLHTYIRSYGTHQLYFKCMQHILTKVTCVSSKIFCVACRNHTNFNPLMYCSSMQQTTHVIPYNNVIYQMYRVFIN